MFFFHVTKSSSTYFTCVEVILLALIQLFLNYKLTSTLLHSVSFCSLIFLFFTCSRSWTRCWFFWRGILPWLHHWVHPHWTPAWGHHRKSPVGRAQRHTWSVLRWKRSVSPSGLPKTNALQRPTCTVTTLPLSCLCYVYFHTFSLRRVSVSSMAICSSNLHLSTCHPKPSLFSICFVHTEMDSLERDSKSGNVSLLFKRPLVWGKVILGLLKTLHTGSRFNHHNYHFSS